MGIPAPIALFTYNRPWHTDQVISHLLANRYASESVLFVFSDGPKNEKDKIKVEEVRNYLARITGFREIRLIEREKNFGLATSIVLGVNEILKEHQKVIVLEDDLVTSPYFLQYMNEALELYENETNVASIHGYTYPVRKSLPDTFFLKGADCWGWATWKRSWATYEQNGLKLLKELQNKTLTREFNFNNSYPYTKMLEKQIKGHVDSWAITWHASCFLSDMLTLYPFPSLVKNIGHDNTGRHSRSSRIWNHPIKMDPVNLKMISIEENVEARQAFEEFFRRLNSPYHRLNRLANYIIYSLIGNK